jgi:signal peptidase II
MKKIFIISIFLIILDFISKLLIVNFLKVDLFLIPNFLYLTFVTNTGTFWGLFSNINIFFMILSIIVLSLLIYIITVKTSLNKLNTILYSLVISGIIGNLIDRIIRGYVVDFIGIKIFNYNFPIFNFADIYIVIGVLLFILIGEKYETR